MATGIIYRPAVPADTYALAELSILAGDGMYEFLLGDMAPKDMLAGLMARTLKQDTGGFSWQHCFVADAKGVVGMINAFPAAWLRDEERDILPQDKVQVLDPIDQVQDWQSFLVNGVAVRLPYRRRGIGTQLIRMAIEQAKAEAFAQMTANLWADNVAARALFEQQGFAVRYKLEIPAHPGLSHTGGSLLMGRQIEAL
jgi:ribosomal protein S18 acetylase RimI-like enzyme